MQSSNSTSPDDAGAADDLFPDSERPSTPIHQTSFPHLTELSPPNSQGVPLPETAATAVQRGANANGKRPLSTLDSNGDNLSVLAGQKAGAPTTTSIETSQVKTHEGSGYSWTRAEDEPGWSWMNKRAQDDANRAWESLVMKDRRVGSQLSYYSSLFDRL